MRRYNIYVKTALAVFALSLSACSSDNDIVEDNPVNPKSSVSNNDVMTFSASMDAGNETRTDFDNNNSTIWASTDSIKIVNRATIADTTGQGGYQWYGNFKIVKHTDPNEKYTKKETFSGTRIQSNGNNEDCFYAFYPATCTVGYTEGQDHAEIKGEVKTSQTAMANTYDQTLHFMTAHSSNTTFAFKNVCALLKITFANSNIKRVKVVANPGLSGQNFTYTYITGKFKSLVSKDDGTTSVIQPNTGKNETQADVQKTYVELLPAKGKTVFADSTYYMVVLPATISNGFTLIMEDVSGNVYQRIATKTTEFERNALYNLGTYDCTSTNSNNYIGTKMTALGQDVVDLGLPSGTLWAAKNIAGYKNGVDSMFTASIYDHGQYYAWGEDFGYKEIYSQSHMSNENSTLGSYNWQSSPTTKQSSYGVGLGYTWPEDAKTNYSWATYKWNKGGWTNFSPSNSDFLKYKGTSLGINDDVAYMKSGGRYCMPTKAQLDELLAYCTYPSTAQKESGKAGARFTSKVYTTKSIWLPAAGSVFNNAGSTTYRNTGKMIQYWTRSYCNASDSYQYAYCLDRLSTTSSYNVDYDRRFSARTIRAVATNASIAKLIEKTDETE